MENSYLRVINATNILKQIPYDKGNFKTNLLKDANRNMSNIVNTKLFVGQTNVNEKQYLQLHSKIEEPKQNDDLERDVSMISIHDDSQNCQYYLPSSADLCNENVARKFHEDVLFRRNLNRSLTVDQLDEYANNISCVAFDTETGDIMVLEILDYMQELECRQLPLGNNFLSGTNITAKQRSEAVSWLFKIVEELAIDRYSVASGMAILDRYIKAKGKSFDAKAYKYIVITSWFIACKWDLLEYPSIEDVCAVSRIKDEKIIHQFEIEILNVIDFYLGAPTPILFLRPLTIMKQREQVSHLIAKCLMEVCLQSYELAGHPAHIIASASYCLAMKVSCRHETLEQSWIPLIQFVTGLDVEDIRHVVMVLARVLCETNFKSEMPYVFSEHPGIFEVFSKRMDELKSLADLE